MKKKLLTLLLAGFMSVMVGCGETTNNTNNNSSSTSSTQKQDNKKEETKKEEVKENKQTIIDDNTAKVEYVKTDKDELGIYMLFHAENKSDKKIVVQLDNSISLDSTMFSALASQDLLPGKQADFKVNLAATDGSNTKIPDFKKASGTLNISDENFELIKQQTFDINK